MIHAHIDAVTTRNIVGFECGTKVDFDKRHSGDPLWVFIDHDVIEHQIDKNAFFLNPRQFFIDKQGMVQQIYVAPIDTSGGNISFVYLTDRDGELLTDSDGTYLTEPV